jgi:hypothetical protein
MLNKDLGKLCKRTLRERIYEEVVHLILSGESPSGGWVDEKQVTEATGESNPVPRGDRDTREGWASRIAAFMCVVSPAMRDCRSLRTIQAA